MNDVNLVSWEYLPELNTNGGRERLVEIYTSKNNKGDLKDFSLPSFNALYGEIKSGDTLQPISELKGILKGKTEFANDENISGLKQSILYVTCNGDSIEVITTDGYKVSDEKFGLILEYCQEKYPDLEDAICYPVTKMKESTIYPKFVGWAYSPNDPTFSKAPLGHLIKIYAKNKKAEELARNKDWLTLRQLKKENPYFLVKECFDLKESTEEKYGWLYKEMQAKYPKLEIKNLISESWASNMYLKRAEIFDYGDYVYIDLNITRAILITKYKWDDEWEYENYVKKSNFTADFIRKLILDGPYKNKSFEESQIDEYIKYVLPDFFKALKEYDEELYKEAVMGTKFEDARYEYLSRTALLSTLSPGKVMFLSPISQKITPDEKYFWDGEYLKKTTTEVDGSTKLIEPPVDTLAGFPHCTIQFADTIGEFEHEEIFYWDTHYLRGEKFNGSLCKVLIDPSPEACVLVIDIETVNDDTRFF